VIAWRPQALCTGSVVLDDRIGSPGTRVRPQATERGDRDESLDEFRRSGLFLVF